MTPEQIEAFRWEKEIDERNRPLTDEELDAMFPFDGYKVGFVIISVVNNDHCTTFLTQLWKQFLLPTSNLPFIVSHKSPVFSFFQPIISI